MEVRKILGFCGVVLFYLALSCLLPSFFSFFLPSFLSPFYRPSFLLSFHFSFPSYGVATEEGDDKWELESSLARSVPTMMRVAHDAGVDAIKI